MILCLREPRIRRQLIYCYPLPESSIAGVVPATWPLPLTKEGLVSVPAPAAQAWPAKSDSSGGKPASPKRMAESHPSSQVQP